MTEAPLPKWSDEVVAESFRSEIRARFEAQNATHLAREAVDLEVFLREHPERRGQPGFEVRDSGAWQVYQESEIRIDRNAVTIVLPLGCAIGIDLVHMFDHTTAAWSRPRIGATIVEGEARPTIEIVLVATWDDSLDDAWREEGNDRRRVLVELYQEEVTKTCMLLDTFASPLFTSDDARKLRERLVMALEALP